MKGVFCTWIKGLKKGTCTQKTWHNSSSSLPPKNKKKESVCMLSQVPSQRFLLIWCKWLHSGPNHQEKHCFVGLLFSQFSWKLGQEWPSWQQPVASRPSCAVKSQHWVGNPALLAMPEWDNLPQQPAEAGRPHFMTELTRKSNNYMCTRCLTWPLL